jgi:hypothetical protein
MTIDKGVVDAYANPIKEWEASHPNDNDINKFLNEIVKVAVEKTVQTTMGWKSHDCAVDYDSKVSEDSITRDKKQLVSREELAWTLGLVALSWLTKVIQGKVEVGHCHTHKKGSGKPCALGKELHLKISKEIASNLRDMADILDPTN